MLDSILSSLNLEKPNLDENAGSKVTDIGQTMGIVLDGTLKQQIEGSCMEL